MKITLEKRDEEEPGRQKTQRIYVRGFFVGIWWIESEGRSENNTWILCSRDGSNSATVIKPIKAAIEKIIGRDAPTFFDELWAALPSEAEVDLPLSLLETKPASERQVFSRNEQGILIEKQTGLPVRHIPLLLKSGWTVAIEVGSRKKGRTVRLAPGFDECENFTLEQATQAAKNAQRCMWIEAGRAKRQNISR